ncbi:hypothetical protein N7548_06510 [Acholeplasma manati]|uniref:Uncharacterized protein n=1 Tax=Paracholeplasma manati TaxID=591373 RepID=A0ABT2Y6W6_9MOLU|nr:hypothetical protein [Paracholeplasma manati]MCV2232475.1 hypothetical protein [Paracholeplasma manati]
MKIKYIILAVLTVLSIAAIDQFHVIFQPIEVIPIDHTIVQPDYDYLVDHRALQMNETYDLKIDELYNTFGFHDIEYAYDKTIVTINKYGEVIPLQPGITNLSITLLTINKYGRTLKKDINYGTIHVIDSNYDNYTLIDSAFKFWDYISLNPSGNYIIGSDLDFSSKKGEFLISYFSGVLINPYGYELTNIHLSGPSEVSIFKYLDHAYINGLIIKDSSTNIINNPLDQRSPRGAAIVAYHANNSYLTNIHVEGTVNGSSNLAGIISIFYYSRLESASFVGEFITNANHLNTVGGLVAYATNSDFENVYSRSVVTGNVFKLGGLFGEFVQSDIQKGYAVVETDASLIEHFGSFAAANTTLFTNNQIQYVYTIGNVGLSGFGVAGSHILSDIESLKTGEPLEGLEAFDFVEGVFPELHNHFNN